VDSDRLVRHNGGPDDPGTSLTGDQPSGLLWIKIADPEAPFPHLPGNTDIRVLLPDDPRFTLLADLFSAENAAVRRVPYLVEDEVIRRLPGDRTGHSLHAITYPCALVRGPARRPSRVTGTAALAAKDAFALLWQAHGHTPSPAADPVAVRDALPAEWAPFFPYPILNPAQAEVVPSILGGDENIVVVAPTGTGKTVLGMVAALKSILLRRRKAIWLVPQRSLTEELNHSLDVWRRLGLRVERLSGEHAVDTDRMRNADLWLATTEKFEAVSRSSALRQALADVDCIVVDELHLLGDAARGATLEALFARVRQPNAPVRVLGLSATIGNAEEIAEWLNARLVQVTWRASRLTWQLPAITAHSDWNVNEAARSRLTNAISRLVTADGGSVLVFCGSRRNVRRTALLLAAGRGADITKVRPDDAEQVHEACARGGVGLHYRDWPYRNEAEAAFRARRFDVLVATPTVSAGVNLPARAVIVRDTQVGLNGFDVATVQQMFGRAGRVGAGENQGWAFLIVDGTERSDWQARLAAGHQVRSQIQSTLADHVLGGVVRQEVTSLAGAHRWWVQTLAHQQGSRDLGPLRQAIRFLAEAGLVEVVSAGAGGDPAGTGGGLAGTGGGLAGEGDERLTPTELGRLTARLMVPAVVGDQLRRALDALPPPTDPYEAERALIDVVATGVPKLAQATVSDEARPAVAAIIATGAVPTGSPAQLSGTDLIDPADLPEPQRGDLAKAALLAVATAPEHFGDSRGLVGGVPYAAMYPALEEAPRYLHWLASQGLLGTVHPWVAIVAGDLGRRVRWRRCRPPRGAGRLLWMCEQMATPAHLREAVPELWLAATGHGYTSPDWPPSRPPRACGLSRSAYRELLGERATDSTISVRGRAVSATGPDAAVLAAWSGQAYETVPIRRGAAAAVLPEQDGDAAVFTWRGDHRATGWLTAYWAIEASGN